jgi:hypothetical protein
MNYFTPVKVNADGLWPIEYAPVSNMAREEAIDYAIAAYGDDAGVFNERTRECEWVDQNKLIRG